MKKILIVLLLCLLTSCTKVISSLQGVVDSIIDTSPKPEEVLPDDNKPNTDFTDPDNNFGNNDKPTEIVINNGKKTHFSDNLKKNGPMTEECFPSIGSPKLLVIPITFSDSNNDKSLDELKHDINIAFNGTEEETGYYSLNGFYKESSYGKLNVTAHVTDFYRASHNSRYYSRVKDGSKDILEEAVRSLDDSIDFSEYDYDNDGFIDGIWLVYDHPVDFISANFWWAFQTKGMIPGTYDKKRTSYYAFAGTDFMYPDKNKNHTYDPKGITIDAHTYIHETGHMMGLDDYYSYNSNHSGNDAYGTYGYDMMDQTHGDHGPLSKLLLGWIDPYIITENTTVSLKSFEKTGDVILIPNDSEVFIRNKTIYAHYYLLICYDIEKINAKDKPIKEGSNSNLDGILVYECHAEKPATEGYHGDFYITGFKYNNSDEKIYSMNRGFDYEKSEWFVRFLTNGKESKSNKRVLFKENDQLKLTQSDKKSVPFNFKVMTRNATNGILDDYVVSIKF